MIASSEVDISVYLISGLLIVVTLQYNMISGREYDKSGQGLYNVPDGIPEDATEINLSANKISKIETNSFSLMSQCTLLNLSYNRISEVEPGAFIGLSAVTWLSLHYNRLDQLSMDMFSGLVSYAHLNSNILRGCIVLNM